MLKSLFTRNRSPGRAAIFSSLALAAALSGCGKAKEPWEVVHPAKGTVTYKGKPVGGALVRLIPQDAKIPESVRPQAKSNEDGTFDVWTYGEKDGAPAGQYKVAVVHYPIEVSPQGAISTKPNDLPTKYSNVETSGLVVEISKGETQFPPFELK